MTLEQMQSDQERDLAAVNREVAAMEAKIAGLDKQLRNEVLRARIAEIRAEAGKALNPLVAGMAGRAKSAAAARQTISKIASLAGRGQERLSSAVSGRSNPVTRMAAVRMAAKARGVPS